MVIALSLGFQLQPNTQGLGILIGLRNEREKTLNADRIVQPNWRPHPTGVCGNQKNQASVGLFSLRKWPQGHSAGTSRLEMVHVSPIRSSG